MDNSTTTTQEVPFNSPEAAVDWYRSLYAQKSLDGNTDQLVTGAQVILEANPNGYLWSRKDEPLMLDAASMLIEASRAADDQKKREHYKKVANKALSRLANNPESTPAVVVDSFMYATDMEFQDIYESYYSGEIEEREFSKKWVETYVKSLDVMLSTMDLLEGQEGYSIGKMFEWFWLQDARKEQLEQDSMDRWFIRSAFKREDQGHNQPNGLSPNFDIAFDEMSNGRWQTTQKIQLGLGSKEKYAAGIQVYQYMFQGSNYRLAENFKHWGRTMRKEAASILDSNVNLNPQDKASLQNEKEFIDSYVPV